MGNQCWLKTSVCCHLSGWKNPAEDWSSCGTPENTDREPPPPPVFNVVEHKLMESSWMFFFCLFSPFFYRCLNEQYKHGKWQDAAHAFIQSTTRTLQWTYAGLCLGDCNATKTEEKKKKKVKLHCKNMPFIKATKCCALLSLKSNYIFFSTEK